MNSPTTNEHHAQAESFLARFGIKCRITLAPYKPASWDDPGKDHGNRHRVTLSKSYKTRGIYPARLVFDFWGSINDRKAGDNPTAYDILAYLSSDSTCPETFADFCAEYGYKEDSRKAFATFKCCATFGKRLRAFFASDELAALAEIN